MGKIERIQVSPEDRERLVSLARDRNTPQKIVWRSQIALLAGEGIGAVEVARRVGKSVLTVRRWRRRYAVKGVDGLLKDATRPPGRKPLTARKIKQVVNLTLNEKPPDATHWSERTMAARAGIAPSSVHKIWAAHGLKPHLSKTFKLSRDPNFIAKVSASRSAGMFPGPVVPDGYRPRGSAAAPRTPRPEFDRHHAPAPDRRPRQNPSAVPVLRSANQEAVTIEELVTQ